MKKLLVGGTRALRKGVWRGNPWKRIWNRLVTNIWRPSPRSGYFSFTGRQGVFYILKQDEVDGEEKVRGVQ